MRAVARMGDRVGPVAVCSRCAVEGPCRFATTATPICERCAPRRTLACRACGKRRWASAFEPGKRICVSCARKRATPRCSGCNKRRRTELQTVQDSRRSLCAVCIAPTVERRCSSCDEVCERRRWPGGLCERCELIRQLDELRQHALAERGRQLEPLLASLRGAPTPGAPLAWLGTSPAARTLRLMLAGAWSISHETLDANDAGQATAYLRARMVALEILPQRDEMLVRFDRWCTKQIAEMLAVPDRTHLAAYARWKLRPELVRRASSATAPSAGRYARRKFRIARQLILLLDQHELTLLDLRQEMVDDWLAEAPSRALPARAFLDWAHQRNATTASLAVRRAAPQNVTAPLDQAHRIDQARWLLDDTTIPLGTRVAALLVLLYGQHASRIARLESLDVRRVEGRVLLTLGSAAIDLPAPVGVLVGKLRDDCVGRWLFPGAKHGSALHPATMSRRINKLLDTPTGVARTSALVALAADVPAPILAELLGYCNDTAGHWRRAASGDWARYAALATTPTR